MGRTIPAEEAVGGGGVTEPNPTTRLFLDWNQPGNWYDDASTYATAMTNSSGTKSAAQQIFGQDTLLVSGGNVHADSVIANGHLIPGINDNWYAYVWSYPTSFPGAAWTILSQGPRSASAPNWRIVGWGGFSPAQQVIFEVAGGYSTIGTTGAIAVERTGWNLHHAQYDAVERKVSLHHDDGAGTMKLCGTAGPFSAGQYFPRPSFETGYPIQVGAQGGFPFLGHIGPVKVAMGVGMPLWPMADFTTPIVADASP